MAHSMIGESVPGMIDRAVARSLRDATKEAGGLIHKEVTGLKVEINQIRQGGQAAEKEHWQLHCQHVLLRQAPGDLDSGNLFAKSGTCAVELSVCQIGYLRCRAVCVWH